METQEDFSNLFNEETHIFQSNDVSLLQTVLSVVDGSQTGLNIQQLHAQRTGHERMLAADTPAGVIDHEFELQKRVVDGEEIVMRSTDSHGLIGKTAKVPGSTA